MRLTTCCIRLLLATRLGAFQILYYRPEIRNAVFQAVCWRPQMDPAAESISLRNILFLKQENICNGRKFSTRLPLPFHKMELPYRSFSSCFQFVKIMDMYKNVVHIADFFTSYNVHPKCAKVLTGMLM